MVVEHWYAHRNIRELTGYETLFKSYTQSPTFAYEYARTLATVKQPFRTPEDAKDAHVSMIDTTRLGPGTIVYHLPALAQLCYTMTRGKDLERHFAMLETCEVEWLVFGVVDAYA